SATTTEPTSTTQEETPTPAPSGTPTSGRGASSRADTLVALHQRITEQAGNGTLDEDTAGKVTEQLEKLAEHLSEGRTHEIPGKVNEIRSKLTEAADKGRWTFDPTTMRLLDNLSSAR
ncbi:hypothetical protein ACFQ07_18750, partial [Actinomadura adrarensis]